MSRDISAGMLTPLISNYVRPMFMAMLTFRSQTVYVWSGLGSLSYGGDTYLGIGSLGKIGDITEGTDVKAYGTTVTLSGIDPVLFGESMTDVQPGLPAIIYFALVDGNGNIYGTPYPIFSGTIDKPTAQIAPDTLTITLALETRLSNLQRAGQRRYTAADQNIYYPDDSAFDWVEILNDQALIWGN